MKKIALLIWAAMALCSCSKDGTNDAPADGQYITEASDLVVRMVLKNGKCTCFEPFIRGGMVSSWENIITLGEYPDYEYWIEGLTITANFESPTAFTAVFAGSLSSGFSNTDDLVSYFDDVTPFRFKLNNRRLDADGDGLLDEMQPGMFGK